jgi:hypothetical protein
MVKKNPQIVDSLTVTLFYSISFSLHVVLKNPDHPTYGIPADNNKYRPEY